jgi:hypothetical protein
MPAPTHAAFPQHAAAVTGGSSGIIQNIQDAACGGRRCFVDLHTPGYAELCASMRVGQALKRLCREPR